MAGLAAAVALLAGGCATMNVSSFVVRGADLAQYQTYGWAPTDKFSTGDPRLDNNTFFQERVQAAVERELAAKGFEKAVGRTPDLLLHYHASVAQAVEPNNLDRPYGYCEDEDCRPEVYDAGTLLIDLVGASSSKLVWRGWAQGNLGGVIDNQAFMERKVDETVALILKQLPGRL
jgi:hypothetical protein